MPKKSDKHARLMASIKRLKAGTAAAERRLAHLKTPEGKREFIESIEAEMSASPADMKSVQDAWRKAWTTSPTLDA